MRTFLIIYLTLLASPLFAGPWNSGKITTYAHYFEGRQCADGSRFSHRRYVVACRRGNFGRRIAIRYGKNGYCEVTLVDRGRLPFHSDSCWQFDTTRAVARKLGLYRIVKGETDRKILWRYIDGKSTTQQNILAGRSTCSDSVGSTTYLARILEQASKGHQGMVYWHAYHPVVCYGPNCYWLSNYPLKKVLPPYALRWTTLDQSQRQWFQNARTGFDTQN